MKMSGHTFFYFYITLVMSIYIQEIAVASTTSRVHIIATGGTILGKIDDPSCGHYTAGVVGIESFVSSVPILKEKLEHGEISISQPFSIDSRDMTDSHRWELAKELDRVLKDPQVEGAVIVHGTDTMEDTAFTFRFLFDSKKPIVFTGAMRPSDHPDPDGPANLINAVAVAWGVQNHDSRETEELQPDDDDSLDQERCSTPMVFITMNHIVASSSKATKKKLNRYLSDSMALGTVEEGFEGGIPTLKLYPVLKGARKSPIFQIDCLKAMPIVRTIKMTELSLLYETIWNKNVKGIVLEGVGDGELSIEAKRHLNERIEWYEWFRGMVYSPPPLIVRTTRLDGQVKRRWDDREFNCVAGQGCPSHKANILLGLFLAEHARWPWRSLQPTLEEIFMQYSERSSWVEYNNEDGE